MNKDSGRPESPVPARRMSRRLLIVSGIAAVVLGLLAYLAVTWTSRANGEDTDETTSPSEDPTGSPSATESSQPVPEKLFLVEWPEDQCDDLAGLLAPPEHVGPASTNEHIDEFGASIAPRCTFQAKGAYAMAEAGEPFFWFQVDAEIAPEAISTSNPDSFQQLATAPTELDPDDWLAHLNDQGQREVTVDCAEADTGCAAGEETTVQAEYFEFWAAYGNLYVEFHVNFYNAADTGALSEQAAAMYGEVFDLLAESIPRERD